MEALQAAFPLHCEAVGSLVEFDAPDCALVAEGFQGSPVVFVHGGVRGAGLAVFVGSGSDSQCYLSCYTPLLLIGFHLRFTLFAFPLTFR